MSRPDPRARQPVRGQLWRTMFPPFSVDPTGVSAALQPLPSIDPTICFARRHPLRAGPPDRVGAKSSLLLPLESQSRSTRKYLNPVKKSSSRSLDGPASRAALREGGVPAPSVAPNEARHSGRFPVVLGRDHPHNGAAGGGFTISAATIN
jgi:hypothetical protein